MNPTTSNFKAEALSNDVLRLQAPSIFAERPMNGLSSRYTFVPTTEIIAGLREKDWLPVDAEQQRARSELRFGFQKHLMGSAFFRLGLSDVAAPATLTKAANLPF